MRAELKYRGGGPRTQDSPPLAQMDLVKVRKKREDTAHQAPHEKSEEINTRKSDLSLSR